MFKEIYFNPAVVIIFLIKNYCIYIIYNDLDDKK